MKYLGKSESEATWEPCNGISTVLIEGFEKRLETVVTVVGDNYNGQMSSTLKSAFQRGESSPPPEKKPKCSNNEIPQEGYQGKPSNTKLLIKKILRKYKDM